MISLSGLSAAYPGFQAQEDQTATTQKNQVAAREAAIKMLGAHVLGQALVGEGPQPPAPGQPSVPNAPPPAPPAALPQGAAPPVPQGGPSVPAPSSQPPAAVQTAPAAGGAPAADTGPEISIQALTKRILATTPGVANHPEILIAALERAAPMLDRQGKEDVAELRNKFTMDRIQNAKDRLAEAARYHDAVVAAKSPAAAAPAPAAAPPAPTATNPQTGAKVQWDGKAWQPIPN